MKKSDSNQIVVLQNNFILLQKPIFLLLKRIVPILVFIFFCATISAQNSNTITPTIMEVKLYISSLKALELNSNSTYSNAQNLEDLLYKIQPSVYFYSGDLKTYGEKPKNLFTDISSLNGLNNSGILKNNIEIVTIKINTINDLNSTIDLSVFSSFNNLKYIYILSSVSATEQKIIQMIQNYDEQYSIFYKIDKGE